MLSTDCVGVTGAPVSSSVPRETAMVRLLTATGTSANTAVHQQLTNPDTVVRSIAGLRDNRNSVISKCYGHVCCRYSRALGPYICRDESSERVTCVTALRRGSLMVFAAAMPCHQQAGAAQRRRGGGTVLLATPRYCLQWGRRAHQPAATRR